MRSTPYLLVAAAALLAAPAVTAQDGVPAPVSADAVVERAIEAMGGRAAFDGLKSHAIAGTKSQTSGTNRRELATSFVFIAPNKVKGVQESPIGPVIMVHDGEIGWVKAGMMKTMPADLDQIGPVSDIARLPRLAYDMPRDFVMDPEVTLVKFDDKPCYRLTMRRRAPRSSDGNRPHELLVDAETGRPAAQVLSTRNSMITTRFRDWKKMGDFMLFTRTYSDGKGEPEFHIETFEANAVEASEFDVPEDLRSGGGD